MKFYSYFDGKTQFSQIFLGFDIFFILFFYFFFGGGGGGGGGIVLTITVSFTCGFTQVLLNNLLLIYICSCSDVGGPWFGWYGITVVRN